VNGWPVLTWIASLNTSTTTVFLHTNQPARDVLNAYRLIDGLDLGVPIHVGLLPGHPAIQDSETLSRIVEGLRDEGVPRVSFYNYGLLPDQSLEWIESAIQ